MDVFALLFIVSFLALILTLAVMHIRKGVNTKDNIAKGSKHIGWVSDVLGRGSESTELRDDGKMHDVIVGKTDYELVYDPSSGKDHSVETKYKVNSNGAVEFIDCRWDDESWMKREVNETQEKWKETLPKHVTRIKLRNSRKLRNKRKGKK